MIAYINPQNLHNSHNFYEPISLPWILYFLKLGTLNPNCLGLFWCRQPVSIIIIIIINNNNNKILYDSFVIILISQIGFLNAYLIFFFFNRCVLSKPVVLCEYMDMVLLWLFYDCLFEDFFFLFRDFYVSICNMNKLFWFYDYLSIC